MQAEALASLSSPSARREVKKLTLELAAAFRAKAWDQATRILKANTSLLDSGIGAAVARLVGDAESRNQEPSHIAAGMAKKPTIGAAVGSARLLSASERNFNAWMANQAKLRIVEEYRALFRRCAEVGIEAAFWEAGKVTRSRNLQDLRDDAERKYLYDDYIAELDRAQTKQALKAWRRMVAHESFAQAPLPLQQQVLGELAELLTKQCDFSGDASVADEAVQCYRRLVATNDEGSSTVAADVHNLGNALIRHFELSGRLDLLDEAISQFSEAFHHLRSKESRGALGAALCRRYEFLHLPIDLNNAIKLLGASRSHSLPHERNHLAIALGLKYERAHARKDLDRAIELLSQADTTSDPTALGNLSGMLLDRYERFGNRHDLRLAHRAIRGALDGAPPKSANRVTHLGNALRVLMRLRSTTSVTNEAGRVITEIRQSSANADPQTFLAALRVCGEWAAAHDDWKQASVAFEQAAAPLDALVRRQQTSVQKAAWIGKISGVSLDAAYAHAKRGDGAAAVLAFERSRAVLLREKLPAGVGTTDQYEVIDEAATEAPLILVAARQWGGLALIVRRQQPVQIVWLPSLTANLVRKSFRRYFAAYANRTRNASAWDTAIDRMTKWLWSAAMGPLVEASVGSCAVVVAAGELGVLPLHAAWVAEASAPSRRRYLVDALAITYAPSVAALLLARRSAATALATSLAAFAGPDLARKGPLAHAKEEVKEAARHFERRTVLAGPGVDRDRIVDVLSRHDVWHFACHGAAAYEILDSGLMLTDNETLTVRDVYGLRTITTGARLAVLSACETALVEGSAPEEAIGFTTALICIGVAGTITSQWAISAGPSTALLLARFYELWREERFKPAEALRQAQRWTRDTTNGEKRARFPHLIAPDKGLSAKDIDVWAKTRQHCASYYWGAFVYSGA